MSNSSPDLANNSDPSVTPEIPVEQTKIEMTLKMRWGLRLVILGGLILVLGISFILFTIVQRLGSDQSAVSSQQEISKTIDLRDIFGQEEEIISTIITSKGLELVSKDQAGNLTYKIINPNTGVLISEWRIQLK